MSLRHEHEIHSRRRGRNVGVGLMLGAFVVLVMLLTYVKITQPGFNIPASPGVGAQVETN